MKLKQLLKYCEPLGISLGSSPVEFDGLTRTGAFIGGHYIDGSADLIDRFLLMPPITTVADQARILANELLHQSRQNISNPLPANDLVEAKLLPVATLCDEGYKATPNETPPPTQRIGTMKGYEKELQDLKKRGVRVEEIHTFKQLEKIRDEFTVGHNGYKTPFLIVIGAPGTAKSFNFEHATDSQYINNAASPVGLYAMVYNCKASQRVRPVNDEDEDENDGSVRVTTLVDDIGAEDDKGSADDLAIILDDIDGLLSDKGSTAMFKALGNDRETKQLSWVKQNSWLESQGIPSSYKTRSRLCILCNAVPKVKRDLQAVFDRAKTVIFAPTAQEIHKYVGKVSDWVLPAHKDIYDFIGQNLNKITNPSLRWYQDAIREKRLGNSWKSWLLQALHDDDPMVSIVADIRSDKAKFPKFVDEVAEFNRRTGLKAAIYKRYVARYKASQTKGAVLSDADETLIRGVGSKKQ